MTGVERLIVRALMDRTLADKAAAVSHRPSRSPMDANAAHVIAEAIEDRLIADGYIAPREAA